MTKPDKKKQNRKGGCRNTCIVVEYLAQVLRQDPGVARNYPIGSGLRAIPNLNQLELEKPRSLARSGAYDRR